MRQKNRLLYLDSISKTYDSPLLNVLDSLSLKIYKDEIVTLLAPSGHGKTTILNIISGLDKAYSGGVHFYSQVKIDYMFQECAILPWYNIKKNVDLPMLLGQSRRSMDKQKETLPLLKKLGLEQFKRNYKYTLSGGMKRKVELAQLYSYNADLILMDEPFSSIDFPQRMKIFCEFLDFVKSNGKSAILVTHDIEEAITLSDRILVYKGFPISSTKELEIVNKISYEDRLKPETIRMNKDFGKYFKSIWEFLNE